MANYAVLDENNIVIETFKGRNEDEIVDGIHDWEEHYSQFHGKTVKRYSFNTYAGKHYDGKTPFRGNCAGVGYIYDEARDVFYPQKPEGKDSFIFDEVQSLWVHPVKHPFDDSDIPLLEDENQFAKYAWNEEEVKWEAVESGYIWNKETNAWEWLDA